MEKMCLTAWGETMEWKSVIIMGICQGTVSIKRYFREFPMAVVNRKSFLFLYLLGRRWDHKPQSDHRGVSVAIFTHTDGILAPFSAHSTSSHPPYYLAHQMLPQFFTALGQPPEFWGQAA